MNSGPNSQGQPKRPPIKNWKSQSKRTADSVKKLKLGIDLLAPWVSTPWGKKLPRTEIPYYIQSILRGLRRRPTSTEQILHELTASLFWKAFNYSKGDLVNLEDVWQRVIFRLEKLTTNLSQRLNGVDHKSAFFSQIAGLVRGMSQPFRDRLKSVLIVRMTKGPRKGKRVLFFEFQDGTRSEVPKNWQPDWPDFLFIGDHWRGKAINKRWMRRQSRAVSTPSMKCFVCKFGTWTRNLRKPNDEKLRERPITVRLCHLDDGGYKCLHFVQNIAAK